jgi:long-chain acyl-CoA synthetase
VASEIEGFWRYSSSHRGQIALVDWDGSTLTFGEAVDQVNSLSRAMLSQGLAAGSSVAILARNQAQFLIAALAAYQIGGCYTAINSHLTETETEYILRDSKPELMFLDRETAAQGTAAARGAGLPLDRIFSLDDTGPGRGVTELISGESAAEPDCRVAGGRMLYTSGTSGRPKGVRPVLTPGTRHATPEQGLSSLMTLIERFGLDAAAQVGDGTHLVTSPLYHAAPLNAALAALFLGHRVVIMRRFDAMTSLRLIGEHGVTWSQVVPTMMKRWLDLGTEIFGAADTSTLRWLIHAGAPCPVDLKRKVISWLGPVVYEYYASTEGGGTAITPQDWLNHPGSVGRPWAGAEIVVLDDAGATVPAGEVGQIYMRVARPFEYHNDPVKTAQSRRGNFVTVGDLGWLDEDGYLFIADRRTDLIISGGVNIYPAEIEAVLLEQPGVVDAAAIGVPDPEMHQVVHAVIQPEPGIDPNSLEATLRTLCERKLSSQKRPKSFGFVPGLPRTEAGKLLRRNLRAEYSAPGGQERGGRR